MLMRLALVLITEVVGRMVPGEAVGLVEEGREDIKLLVMLYILEMCNNILYSSRSIAPAKFVSLTPVGRPQPLFTWLPT